MTSRERILRAIRQEPVDRVPVCTYELCGYNSASFENREGSYRQLMDLIRKETDTVTMWNPRSITRECLSSWQPDIVSTTYNIGEMKVSQHTLRTPAGRTLTATEKRYRNVYTTWQTEHWCKDIDDINAYLSIPFIPSQYDFSDYGRVLSETAEHGIVMATLADPACTAMELMEFGESTVWAMTETEHFAETIQEIHRRNMINLKSMLDAGVVDLYRICGPEYMTPPYLPPRLFERFVTPYDTEMTALIHQYGALVRIHSHGKIGRVLDSIIACGADALDPCEAPPDGDITLSELKSRAGGRLCLFGNLQLKLLENGSPEDVREAVKVCMESAKGSTGYVIMPTASPINIPLSHKTYDNYAAFIETAIELGAY